MYLENIEYVQKLVTQEFFSAKMVFNASGAIFFPVSQQHRDIKHATISYEDDYKGNALAAMLAPGKIEIRFQQSYSDGCVTTIVKTLLSSPELSFMAGWQVTYQGRTLIVL